MGIFINISNHPSARWGESQLAATKVSRIIDIPFPQVPPSAGMRELEKMSRDLADQVEDIAEVNDEVQPVVHIMGEMGLTFATVTLLQKRGYTCVHSTTERKVVEQDGIKSSIFEFVKFRGYSR